MITHLNCDLAFGSRLEYHIHCTMGLPIRTRALLTEQKTLCQPEVSLRAQLCIACYNRQRSLKQIHLGIRYHGSDSNPSPHEHETKGLTALPWKYLVCYI